MDEFRVSSFLLSTVESKPVDYIWKSRLAKGMLAIWDGDPSTGKTTAAMDILARITTGRGMPKEVGEFTPDHYPRRGVVLMTAEDSLEQTIKPRMEAAGADLTRVGVVVKRREGARDYVQPSLPEDIEGIANQVDALDAAMILIDPAMAYISGGLDSNNDQNVRAALSPLVAMAQDKHCCVLMIRHVNKASGTNAMYRGGGSIGIIGSARFGFAVARDPADETGATRVLAPIKVNVGKEPLSIRYTLESVEGMDVPRVVWGEECSITPEDLWMASKPDADQARLRDCIEWLQQEMDNDTIHQPQQKEVMSHATRDGWSRDEVKNAMKMLDIGTHRQDATQDMVLIFRASKRKPVDTTDPFNIDS